MSNPVESLTVEQWYEIVSRALSRREVKVIPDLLALMAASGHPREAEEMLRELRLMSAVKIAESNQRQGYTPDKEMSDD